MTGRLGWKAWYRRWEAQQEAFNRDRERRFSAMLDLVAASLPARFTALDLGCGPGSLCVRLLERFPHARCVAVDRDPVVLRVGQGAFGTMRGRLRWVDTELGAPGWDRALPPGRFDAALSTTALHWLDRPHLMQLGRDLARRLRPGGIFVDGDRLPWGTDDRRLARLAKQVRSVRIGPRRRATERSAWQAWWDAAHRDPELRSLFPLRQARHAQHPRSGDLPLSAYVRALRGAGFRSAAVVWRDLEDAILYARR